MQPPSSGTDPYYPQGGSPTSGAPASPYASPAATSTFPAAGSPSSNYPPYGSGDATQNASFNPPTSYSAPPSFNAAPPPGNYAAPPPGPSKGGLVGIILGIVVALIVVGVGSFYSGYLFGKDSAESTAAAPAPGRPSGPAPSGAPPSASAQPDGVAGTWKGTYTCSQGDTGLTLTVAGPDSQLTATFEFYPTAGGSGEKGSYKMGGALVSGYLNLNGTEWIDQPAGYEMVSISSSDITATKMTGKVLADGCTEFSVTRA